MDEVAQLVEKINSLKDIPAELEIFTLGKHRLGVVRRKKKFADFSLSDLEKAAEFFRGRKRKIILDFIELFRCGGSISPRTRYVNIIFNFSNHEKISEIIKKNGISFRSFLIKKLCEEFSIKDFKQRFSQMRKSEIHSNQILIPQELFLKIWNAIEKREKREFTNSSVRKAISVKIEEILNKL